MGWRPGIPQRCSNVLTIKKKHSDQTPVIPACLVGYSISVLTLICVFWHVTEDKVTKLLLKEEIYEGLKEQESVFQEVNDNSIKSQKRGQWPRGQFSGGRSCPTKKHPTEHREEDGRVHTGTLQNCLSHERQFWQECWPGIIKKEKNLNEHLSPHPFLQPEERMPAKFKKMLDLLPLAVSITGNRHLITPNTVNIL